MVVQNLSLCLRFRIQSWSSSFYLVKSDSVVLIISPYDPKHLGYLWFSNHDNYFVYAFGPKKYLSFSTSVWNSICLAYSLSFQSLTIVVNGKTVNTQIQKRSGEAGNLSLSNIELASNNQFQAFITDFNAWSRALSLDEALSYSSGSGHKSRPDIFDWTNLKEVILNEKCTEWRSFDAEMVSLNNAIFNNPEVIYLHPLNFDEASKMCETFNGVIFDPKNSSYFNRVDNFTHENIFSDCNYQFWVPSEKVGKAELPDQYSSDLLVNAGIQNQNNCPYFSISKGKYGKTECTSTSLCALCEVSQERLSFVLRSDCPALKTSTRSIFNMQQNSSGYIKLSGVISSDKYYGSEIDFNYDFLFGN